VTQQQLFSRTFPNGLVLLAEAMDWLESAAFALLLPAGCAYEPGTQAGLASLTCEMTQRGSGTRDSRQFVSAVENLGADTSANVSNSHTSFGGAMPAESLHEVLGIYADLVRRPHLPADQLDDARAGCIQEVRAVEDDLAQKLMIAARGQFYAEPYGRASLGTEAGLESATIDAVQQYYERHYHPQRAILAVAGKIDWPMLSARVEELFADWKGHPETPLTETPPRRGYRHVPADSQQVHLSVAFDAPSYATDDYFQIRGAIGVLSDGMSSRLFTEVREKRGLCYTVYAQCHSLRDRGGVFGYAGTTADRAQEPLDVLSAEIRRLHDGVEEDELSRLKRRIKRALIIQQESSSARAGGLAHDWYYLNRVRPIEELRGLVDGLSAESINRYLAAHRPREFSVVTLGPKPLEAADGVS
jgi:predicted Zn-dependent peptidase